MHTKNKKKKKKKEEPQEFNDNDDFDIVDLPNDQDEIDELPPQQPHDDQTEFLDIQNDDEISVENHQNFDIKLQNFQDKISSIVTPVENNKFG